MATLAEVEAHQQAVTDLTTLAQAELVATWRAVDLANPSEVAEATRDVLPAIVAAYTLAGATLAADFYEDIREAAGVAGAFAATLADGPSPERVDALIGWGLEPLFRQRDVLDAESLAEEYGVEVEPRMVPASDPDKALSRLSGGLQRIVANADRDTIAANVERDPADATWARHASANACAFCAMLATRDAVYATKESATRVVGRGTDRLYDGTKLDLRRKGVKARGTRELGDKYHDDCRCIAVPEWPDEPLERAPYVDDWAAAYKKAFSQLEPGTPDYTKELLANMRQILGAR